MAIVLRVLPLRLTVRLARLLWLTIVLRVLSLRLTVILRVLLILYLPLLRFLILLRRLWRLWAVSVVVFHDRTPPKTASLFCGG